jgi:hypothetical protein
VSETTNQGRPSGRVRIWRDLAFVGVAMLVAMIGHVLWASSHMRVELTRDRLAVSGDVFGPDLPLADLSPTSAQIIDPVADPQLRITGRILGGGFAGYRSGWFRLANGARAQVFLRDGERALYVPTRHGYALLVSAADPDALLRTLKQNYSYSRD